MKLYAAAATVALLLAIIQTTPAAAEEQEQENTDSVPEKKDEAITEPPIKLVHVLNPGEREYLSPNLIGVQNIAMTFLPLSMNFVNIIDAYREIVNGVRYEILLNAVDTKDKDADTVCRLVILEKPWQTTQWGDKYRELVNSNCSDVADNALSPESEERSKALNDKYVSNGIFNGGRRNELSDSEMARLESQILTTGPNGKRKVSSISSSPSSTSISTTTTTASAVPQAEPTNEPRTSISVDEAATVSFESDIVDGTTPSSPSTLPTAELNDNEKRWLDDFLSVGAYNFEKTIEQQRLELNQQKAQEQEQREAGGAGAGAGP
ncbi:hypothetical protein ACLKA7_008237 [Drosophila subpalustris]